jgi:5-methylthioadenosine/S-adenosylhomocysteine deaminase
MSILLRGARVLTLDAADTEHAQADILIQGTLIAAVGPNLTPVDPPEMVIDARGLIAMPGLINGHFHSQANLMAGSVASRPLELFMLYEVPPLGDRLPDPRLIYLQTMLGAVEMLRAGVTAVHDDAFHNPWPTRTSIDAVMSAYRDSGLRATVSINHPNRPELDKLPFLAEILPPDIRAEVEAIRIAPLDELIGLYRWFHGKWHDVADGRLRIAVSNSAPQRVTEEYFAFLSAFSREHDLPFDIHILETKLQRVLGIERFGKSLVKLVHDLGFLDERMLVVHAIWIDTDDMDLLADSGCTIAHNPICNLRLGSGVMPFRQLRDRSIPIALGTDERSADDTINLWAAMKQAGLIHQITDPDDRRWPTPMEVLNAATNGGARGMRLANLGRIEAGCLADIILLDTDSLAFTPMNDLRRQLVYSQTGSSVVTSIVAGRIVMRDGRVLTVDEAALRAEIRERQAEIDADIAATTRAANRLEPYWRAMYQKAVAVDVGFTRWVRSGR